MRSIRRLALNCVSRWRTGSGGTAPPTRNFQIYRKISNANVVGISNTGIQVSDFSLQQNYPNPFNPTTNIKFSLPENSFVSLKVFDVNGREVADVINEKRNAGIYEISFDANKYGLSSGMYYYTLTSGSFKESKKMILIK